MNNFLTPDTALALMQTNQSDSGKALEKLREAQKTKDLSKVEEAAQEFEAVFLSEMLKPMFEGIETEPPFGGGKGEEVFRSLMIQEYGKIIAQSGGLGFADQVREEMIRLQEEIDGTQHNDNQ